MNIFLIILGAALVIAGLARIVSSNAKAPSGGIADSSNLPVTECCAHAASQSAADPVSHNKAVGNDFENFVANLFSVRDTFKVLEWNQGQTSTDGVYAEQNKRPDFKIRQTLDNGSKIYFWVECKYRSALFNNAITVKEYQLIRYRIIQRTSHRKIFLAIGIGGSPSAPDRFALLPLDSVKSEDIHNDAISNAVLSDLSSKSIASFFQDYFLNKVFTKPKPKKKASE